jgi:predicted esterase
VTNLRVVCLLLTLGSSSHLLLAGTLYLDPVFGVQKTSNIVYGQGIIDNGAGHLNLTLDVYRPTNIGTAVPESRPTILWIHGGGWRKGKKEQVMQENEWVSRGYNLVSINYRLQDDNPPLTTGVADAFIFLTLYEGGSLPSVVNASLEDAVMALDWIDANAAIYGFDTNRVGIGGHSAGAVNAIALGQLVRPEIIEPKAIISVAGAVFNGTNPFSPGGPPTMLIAGSKDNTVPSALVEFARDQLNEVGVTTEYYLQPNVGHQPRWDTVIDGETLSQHGIEFLYNNLATVGVPEASSTQMLTMVLIGATSTWGMRRAYKQRVRDAQVGPTAG